MHGLLDKVTLELIRAVIARAAMAAATVSAAGTTPGAALARLPLRTLRGRAGFRCGFRRRRWCCCRSIIHSNRTYIKLKLQALGARFLRQRLDLALIFEATAVKHHFLNIF